MTEEIHLGAYEYFKRVMHIVKHNIKQACKKRSNNPQI